MRGDETGTEGNTLVTVVCVVAMILSPLIMYVPLVMMVVFFPLLTCLLVVGLAGSSKLADGSHPPPGRTTMAVASAGSLKAMATPPRMPQTRAPNETMAEVQVLRGGELVGNRLRYKVKVLNTSKYVITDVTVSLVAYPRDALAVEGLTVKTIAKIEPRGFVSSVFEFLPTRDCVRGDIIANVFYVDYEGRAHTAMTEPFTVRAVCDLLVPQPITPEDFEDRLQSLSHGEMASRVDDWTPEEMHSKALQVLTKLNFSEVKSQRRMIGNQVESKITGWARGKYTGKNLGVEILITGRLDMKGATCKVRISGQDEAMILPAIDEMAHSLSAWLCPVCVGELPLEAVDEVKAGRQAKCPFCGVTVAR